MSFVSSQMTGAGRGNDQMRAGKAATTRLAGTVGGGLFVAGAAIGAAAILLPHPESVDTTGYWLLVLAELAFGIGLFAWSRMGGSARLVSMLTIAGAITAITASVYLNGERDGGPALINEFFYVWPAIYAGYFFRWQTGVAVVAAICAAYVGVEIAIGVETTTLVTRTLITVTVVAGVAGVALALRRYVDALVARLDGLARTDTLTALTNRRGFDGRLTEELARYRRSGTTLALLLGDMDRFKGINDRFGHAAGDEVLRQVGRAIMDSARGVDTTARIGGEEFAVLMPETSAREAVAAADRLRRAVGEVRDPAGERVEITFGVASTDDEGCADSDGLLSAADQALYSAKEQGRNRTVAYVASERKREPALL
jgi:diguanylate cyclase (GGDEF)-like protein